MSRELTRVGPGRSHSDNTRKGDPAAIRLRIPHSYPFTHLGPLQAAHILGAGGRGREVAGGAWAWSSTQSGH